MTDPRIPLKNPILAAVLAFLIPGAGHLYQGRLFKGVVYAVCILGTFFYGMALGNWQVVYYRGDPGNRPYGYFAQVMVGLPALPAIAQWRRYDPTTDWLHRLDSSIDSPFEGTVEQGGRPVAILNGTIHLSEVASEFGPTVRGVFDGTVRTLADGVEKPQTFDLAEGFRIEPVVLGSPRRRLEIGIDGSNGRQVAGTVERSFWNWFEAPLDRIELERLHGDLGKIFELASVFTWIAGLLNILAIWDALEGPAYGYGDEPSIAGTATAESPQAAEPPAPPPPRQPVHAAGAAEPPPHTGPPPSA